MARPIPDKLKSIFTDTVWSFAGLVLMNAAAQFVVYPYWNKVLGSESYGNVVYLLAIMNVMAISVGSGINYARMRRSAGGETANRPYLLLMAAGAALSVTVLLLLRAVGLVRMQAAEFRLFCALTAVTTWRYYADVEYRLRVNYKGFFLYYLVIGLGYLPGLWLFRATGLWPLALLPGELAGLLFVLFTGSIFRKDGAKERDFSPILRLSLLLVGSNLLSHLIFNGDRLVLRWFAGGAAVTVYYVASLFGKTMTFISTPLNGVLVGHLAKYDGKLTKRLMHRATALACLAAVLASAACFGASHVVLPLLYPEDFPEAARYLLLASSAQVLYFVGNVLTASVLLRFTKPRNQLIVNAAHGALFAAVCIPAALLRGLDGFCPALFAVNAARFVLCLALGYLGIKEKTNEA